MGDWPLASPARSKRFKKYAAECIRLAHETDDQIRKHVLLEMAEKWRLLAEQAETKDK
jgi:hypothetical protein